VLTEIKKIGTGSELKGKLIDIWSGVGRDESKKRSFDCNKSKWKKNIIMVEKINERILKMIIKVYNIEFVIIAIYGPNEDAQDREKDDFYDCI
jgi:hypothetical protein